MNLSRFLGPIAARFILDFGGRNTYAAVQVFVRLCLLCLLSSYEMPTKSLLNPY